MQRVRRLLWMVATMVRCGMLAPLRPDKYVRMALAVRRRGITPLTGLALAAARNPDGLGLVDERGALTWSELDRRADALAVGLRELHQRTRQLPPRTVAILARNHRGFVEALAAADRLGADALLLNTGFSGPQLTDVLVREKATLVVYDEEFEGLVAHARGQVDHLVEVLAWTEHSGDDPGPRPTVDALVDAHLGARLPRPANPGRVILLTSGTTGTPKGAKRSAGGGLGPLTAMLDRIPWRAEETVVVAAPMFHAWGFGQLAFAATLTCTVVTRRRFDPEATLRMVDDHRAQGLAVVPVMLERITALPDEVLDRYSLASLRFVTASGSRMRADSVARFMDRFGELVHNSYNATEAGMISTATPDDLRVAPDTAGRPLRGTELRILDDRFRPVPVGEIGRIAVLSDSQFEGYTSGDSKDFHERFMISGDLGRVDDDGRLFVVGRDDEMIVSGGENVYPLEVEQVLNAHPAVQEAAVIGVDDEEYGQRLAAFVVRDGHGEVTAEELKQHVKAELAGYKVPREVRFLDELPRNASGKIVKRELAEGL